MYINVHSFILVLSWPCNKASFTLYLCAAYDLQSTADFLQVADSNYTCLLSTLESYVEIGYDLKCSGAIKAPHACPKENSAIMKIRLPIFSETRCRVYSKT